MSEGVVSFEKPGLGRIGKGAAVAIAAAGLVVGGKMSYDAGAFNSAKFESKGETVETIAETKSKAGEYYRKVAVDVPAFDKDGNLTRVSGKEVDPLTDEIKPTSLQVRDNPDVDGDFHVYRDAHIGTGTYSNETLKSTGVIDKNGNLIVVPVYGYQYGNVGDPNNIFGDYDLGGDKKAGIFFEVTGKDADGNEMKGFIPAPEVVVESKVINVGTIK